MSPAPGAGAEDWLVDESVAGERVLIRVRRRLQRARTSFQRAEVVETDAYGTTLVLDGSLQSSSKDEFIYHESLVHPAMLACPAPRQVAILGGGEGATLREVLRHRMVRRATMIDIDEEVVAFCRRHMPSLHAGAFDDPRARLLFEDARAWLERQPEGSQDVIVSDLSEPIEEGPARMLYTREFYREVHRVLAPDGVLAVQASQASHLNHGVFVRIHASIRGVFDRVHPMTVYVDSFSDNWGFFIALKGKAALPEPDEVDVLLDERTGGPLRHYDGQTHRHMTSLPRPVRRALEEPASPYTDGAPPGIKIDQS